MEKFNCMTKLYSESTEIQRLQVVYLRLVAHQSYNIISHITLYAVSTCRSYASKYSDLLEESKNYFYFEETIEKQVMSYEPPIRKNNDVARNERIIWECESCEKGTPCAYICDIYDINANKLFMKVGFSSQVKRRMNEHIPYYMNNKFPKASTLIVKYIFPFGTQEEALTMENFMRAYYRKKNEDKDFLKNDRFLTQSVTKKDINIFIKKTKQIVQAFSFEIEDAETSL